MNAKGLPEGSPFCLIYTRLPPLSTEGLSGSYRVDRYLLEIENSR